MKKNKSKKKWIIVILIILILLCLGVFALYYFFDNKNNTDTKKEVKVIKEISKYGYELKENATKLYKAEFENLESVLNEDEIDYEMYAKAVAKLFIIDFYTLNNKESKNDIGGTAFIKDSMKDNFIEEARSTFYKYLEVKENRNQVLPEVSLIGDVQVENTSFTYTDKTKDENAYKVTISWDYKENLGYEKEAKMILVKENDKLYIIEMD